MYFITAKIVRKLSYAAEIKKKNQTNKQNVQLRKITRICIFFSLLRSKNKTKSYFPSRNSKTLWSGTREFFNHTRVFKSTMPNFL